MIKRSLLPGFLLLLLLPQPFRAADSPKREIRAVWLTTIYRIDWPKQLARDENSRKAQQTDLCNKLDQLKAANFNMVFLQVRLRGDVIYPSSIEPMSSVFTGKIDVSPGYDPLAFAVEECHRRGMECHAWFVTFPVGTARAVKSRGNKTVVRQKPSLCKLHEGEWHLDPGMPGTTDYILSLVRELVSGYDIDGIHFDYIRYPEHPESFPDRDTYNRYGNSRSYAAWRRDNINRMVARIYDEVKRLKPWVQVSSSPLGKYNKLPQAPNAGWTALDVHQDPQDWMRQEKQDMVAPMMYYKDNLFYPFLDNWLDNNNGRYIVPGLGVYRMADKSDWSVQDIRDQIEYLRKVKAAGCSFYQGSQVLNNAKGLYDALKNDYFKYPALLPPLTWLSNERPASPTEVRVERKGNRLILSWEKPADETQPLTYTVYYSRTGSVNTNRARNILATGLRETVVHLSVDPKREQEFTFRVTASSPYRIESKPSRETYYYLSRYSK
jgi:uncharacterized lipoprotein YddW (UPF0748 family)